MFFGDLQFGSIDEGGAYAMAERIKEVYSMVSPHIISYQP